jgi:hypothetical protein
MRALVSRPPLVLFDDEMIAAARRYLLGNFAGLWKDEVPWVGEEVEKFGVALGVQVVA